jgi:AraC-like DNA-binding protein
VTGNVNGTVVQRAGVGSELPDLLRGMGIDPGACLAGTGIDPDTLAAESRVPFVSVLEALDRAAQLSGCAHFGLLLGLRFRMEHQGLIGRLMATAPTLRRAFADFVTWQPGYSSGAVIYLVQQGDSVVFGYGTVTGPQPGSRQMYDCAIAVAMRMVEHLTAGRVRPTEVQLPYRAPEDAVVYSRLLKVPVRFGQPRGCLVFDASEMEARLAGTDAERHRGILAEIKPLMRELLPDVRARVCHALRPLVQDGRSDMGAVAAALGVHPRTLRRQLAAEGAVFSDLRDGVRFAMAREFLSLTDLPVGEVAAAVGFPAQGVFSESFRRWSGTTPSDWRRTRRRSAPA